MDNKQQHIITAVKNKHLFLKVPALKNAEVILSPNGTPFVITGGFNMVFQLTLNVKKWAFRVWHKPMGENQKRFHDIAKSLSLKKLPYFADFIYDKNGILVNGEYIDTIRMEWLEGDLLKEYIDKNIKNGKVLKTLALEFHQMCSTLRKNNISHGDLQEGNILIDKKGSIKLIDYDSLCTPEIEGQKELITGLPGYQHPSRFNSKLASLKADYFSELIIYLSILAFSENKDLWVKYKVKDTQVLLFTQEDFENFNKSEIKKDLLKLSPKIIELVKILEKYLKEKDFTNLIPFDTFLTQTIKVQDRFIPNNIRVKDDNNFKKGVKGIYVVIILAVGFFLFLYLVLDFF